MAGPSKKSTRNARPRGDVAARDASELARVHAAAAIERLAIIMKGEDDKLASAACNTILERAYGKPPSSAWASDNDAPIEIVNGGAKLVHPGGAKLVHLTLCGTRCWGVVPVVHRRDPRCFV